MSLALLEPEADGEKLVDQFSHKAMVGSSERVDSCVAGFPGYGGKGVGRPLVAADEMIAGNRLAGSAEQ